MAHKLWEKNFEVNKEIERFTVGRDRELDLYLAKYDVLGSMAHITMLESIGLLEKSELDQLLAELKQIYAIADKGEFVIEDGVEDVHSQVELMLTQKFGEIEVELTVSTYGESFDFLVYFKVLCPKFMCHFLLNFLNERGRLRINPRMESSPKHQLSSRCLQSAVSSPFP